MNYILHLNSFFERADNQDWLTPHHQSLYLTLFRIWNQTKFVTTFTINRDVVMNKAKIGSKTTYYRCLKELENAGYFKYHPARTRYEPAKITMISFSYTRKGTIQVPYIDRNHPTSGTVHVPQQGHFPKQSDKNLNHNSKQPLSPSQEEVNQFFLQNNYPPFSATNFWNQYESKHWYSGGSPVRNWKALAHKWMMRINPVNSKNTIHANSNPWTSQSYQEPF